MNTVCLFSTDDPTKADKMRAFLEKNEIRIVDEEIYIDHPLFGKRKFSGYDMITGKYKLWINKNSLDKAVLLVRQFEERIRNGETNP